MWTEYDESLILPFKRNNIGKTTYDAGNNEIYPLVWTDDQEQAISSFQECFEKVLLPNQIYNRVVVTGVEGLDEDQSVFDYDFLYEEDTQDDIFDDELPPGFKQDEPDDASPSSVNITNQFFEKGGYKFLSELE